MYVVLIMLIGVTFGYFLQHLSLVWLNKTISVAIFLLVFLLGIAVGANDVIMNNITTIGVKGLLIGFASLIGSVLMVWGISKLLNDRFTNN
jgi:hypothetical protein